MKILDFSVLRNVTGTASVIFVAVIVILWGLSGFLSDIMGLAGGMLQTWTEVTSNMLFMFVLVICVLYAANVRKRRKP